MFFWGVVVVVVAKRVVFVVHATAPNRSAVDLASNVSVRLFERPFGLDTTGFDHDQSLLVWCDLSAQNHWDDQPLPCGLLDLAVESNGPHNTRLFAVFRFGLLADDARHTPSKDR